MFRSKLKILTAICLLIASGACTKKGDDSPQTKYLTESTNLSTAKKVSNDLGVQITLADNKDFQNEVEYNRIMNLMELHRDLVVAHSGEIDQVMIGAPVTRISASRDKYIVNIALYTSETDLIRLFGVYFDDYKNTENKSRVFSAISSISIVDTVGLQGENTKAAADKLRQLELSINFSQDPTFRTIILGSSGFGVNLDGMTIDITTDADAIINAVKLGLDARITWAREIAPLSRDLGVNFSYQAGVFDGKELDQLIAKVKSQATLISSVSHKFTNVIFGKHWDNDLNQATMLVDYQASDADIVNQFQKFDIPVTTIDFNPVRAEIDSAFANRGFKFDRILIDIPPTTSNLSMIKSFQFGVASAMQIASLQKLHVSVLHLGTDPTAFIAATNALYLRLPTSADEVDAFLATLILKKDFDTHNLAIKNNAANLGLLLSESFDFIGSQEQNDRLGAFEQWMSTNLTTAVLASASVSGLRITDAGTPTTFDGGTLTVDLQTFDPSQIGSILNPPKRR